MMTEDFDDELTPKEQAAENAEFARTGSFSFKMKYKVKVTEKDLLKDLVDKTEGEMIKPKDLDETSKN